MLVLIFFCVLIAYVASAWAHAVEWEKEFREWQKQNTHIR